MTSSSTPPQDIVTQLRSIKGVDTKTIMKQLCRLANNIPPEVDDNNPNFIGMTLIENELTHSNNLAKRYLTDLEQSGTSIDTPLASAKNYPTYLDQMIASIETPLAALEQKRDARLLPSDLQEFALLKAEVKKRGEEHKNLIQTINKYIDTKREKFADITKKLTDKTPRTQKQVLPAELKTIEKQVADLRTQADKKNATEDTLQRRLYSLHKRISSAAFAAFGMKSAPLPRPGGSGR